MNSNILSAREDRTKFKRILAATILRFHNEFFAIIENKPSSKYKYATYHPFNQSILLVLTDIGYAMSTFWKWQKEVLAGFKEKNWLGVRISKSRPQNLIRQKL